MLVWVSGSRKNPQFIDEPIDVVNKEFVYDLTAGIAGASGWSGYSGYSGIGLSGYSGSGSSGFSGNSGYSGLSGFSGATAVSGYSGKSGYSGLSGTSGVSGYSGYSGYSGIGSSGFSGTSGLSGISGFSGASAGQTPWLQNENASGYSLSNLSGLTLIDGNAATVASVSTGGLTSFTPTSTTGNVVDINIPSNFTFNGGNYVFLVRRAGTTYFSIDAGGGGTTFSKSPITCSGGSNTYGTGGPGLAVTKGWNVTNTTGLEVSKSFSIESSLAINGTAAGGDKYYDMYINRTETNISGMNGDNYYIWFGTGGVMKAGIDRTGNITSKSLAGGGTQYVTVDNNGVFGASSGGTGTSGYSGASGISGYSGTNGTIGSNGASGFSGISGSSGISGYSGYSGKSGFSGISGYSGYSGTSGYSGVGTSGFSGTNGSNGGTGTSGFSGVGTTGTSGFSGISGYSGYSGISGYSGYSGTPSTSNNEFNITPVTVNANSTGAQSLMAVTMNSACLNTIGNSMVIRCFGVATTATTSIPTFTIQLGGVTIASWAAASITATVTAWHWAIDLTVSTITTGATGTVEAHGFLFVKPTAGGGSATTYIDAITAASGSISLTGTAVVQTQITFSANGAGGSANACTQRQMVISQLQ